MKKILCLAVGLALSFALAGPVRADHHEDKEHYERALIALKEALTQLERVDSNHDNHRDDAIKHVREAVEHAESGLRHARHRD